MDAISSVEIDSVKTRDLYARTGAREYLILGWRQKSPEVWTFTQSPARAIACTAGQTISTPPIPGLVVLADELSS